MSKKIVYTDQQVSIIKAAMENSGNILVSSKSGVGKTSTLFNIFRHMRDKRFLLLSFNRHLTKEYTQKKNKYKLDNVDAMTIHKLAKTHTLDKRKVKVYDETFIKGDKYYELLPFIHSSDLQKATGVNGWKVSKLVKDFCKSTDDFHDTQPVVLEVFKHYFRAKSVTHDMYMKVFQLGVANGDISLADKYDVVAVDECLTGDTRVELADGKSSTIVVIIRKLNRNEKVVVNSFNIETNTFELKEACNPMVSHNRKTITINGYGMTKINCTPNHKILTSKGWIEAGNLKEYDLILKSNKESQNTLFMMNKDQEQIVLGSYFGDGCINHQVTVKNSSGVNKRAFRLALTHGVKQKDYLIWKSDAMQCGKLQTITSGCTDRKDIFSRTTKMIALEYNLNLVNIMNKIQPLGLAIWLMDDGSINGGRLTLNSNNLTEVDNNYISKVLKERFNIHSSLISDGRGYFKLVFSTTETSKLICIIKPFIHKDLEYKFNTYSEYSLDNNYLPYGCDVVNSIVDNGVHTVYDFEVKDNHNFLVGAGESKTIVHNCQDLSRDIIDIFFNLDIKSKIAVGDEFQAILGFLLNGYKVFNDPRMDNFKKFSLSKSFRCSPAIADSVNRSILRPYLHSTIDFVGNPDFDYLDKSSMHLARTNNEVLIIAYREAKLGNTFVLTAKLSEVISNIKSLMHIISKGNEIKYCTNEFQLSKVVTKANKEMFKDVLMYVNSNKEMALVSYLKKHSSSSIKSGFTLLNLLKDKGIDISEFEEVIRKGIDPKSNIKISNVHLVKGSETGTVTMNRFKSIRELQDKCVEDLVEGLFDAGEDNNIASFSFKDVEESYSTSTEYYQYLEELYILYVGITRAKHTVNFVNCGHKGYWIESDL